MTTHLNTRDHYWIVGDSSPATQVYSNAVSAYVANNAAAYIAWLQLGPTFYGLPILGAANNGSGLVRLTLAATTNLLDGQRWAVQLPNYVGVPTAYQIDVIDATHFDLVGSTFSSDIYTGGWVQGPSYVATTAELNAAIASFEASGDLIINKRNPGIRLRKAANTSAVIDGQTDTALLRWRMTLASGAPESGANAGSDFSMIRYNDAGVGIDNPFTIARNTGIAAFASTPTAPTATFGDNTTSLATTAFVQAAHKFKSGSTTRDLTLASGSQAVTGVGFTPKSIVFMTTLDAGSKLNTIGYVDEARAAQGMYLDFAAANGFTSSAAIFVAPTGVGSGNFQSAAVLSYDADGFTLSWTKTGTPTGTARVMYLAIR